LRGLKTSAFSTNKPNDQVQSSLQGSSSASSWAPKSVLGLHRKSMSNAQRLSFAMRDAAEALANLTAKYSTPYSKGEGTHNPQKDSGLSMYNPPTLQAVMDKAAKREQSVSYEPMLNTGTKPST
jgi:hypothetical protein